MWAWAISMLWRQVLLNEDQKFCSISYLCCGHQYIPHSGRQPAPFNPDNCDRNSQAAEQSKEFQGNTSLVTLVPVMHTFDYVIPFTDTLNNFKDHQGKNIGVEYERGYFKVTANYWLNKMFVFQENLENAEEKRFLADDKYLTLLGFSENPRLYPNATWKNTSLPIVVTYVSVFILYVKFMRWICHFSPQWW